MAKYWVMIEGINYWLEDERGAFARYGFFQNHWVEAPDPASASEAVLATVSAEPRWAERHAEVRAGVSFRVKQVIEVDTFEGVGANPSGLNLFRAPRPWEFWKKAWWLNLSPW